jgi:YHS domain-containing protein
MVFKLAGKVFLVIGILVICLAALQASARDPVAMDKEKVAMGGYDPVGYFDGGKAIKGKAGIESRWNGAVWRFASEKHRKMFEANPEKYAPQYGGYCALSVAEDSPAAGDPQVWTINDGRLYLCFNQAAQKRFQQNEEENLKKADEMYKSVLEKK